MPRARRTDGDATKQKILFAASKLIAQNGFAKSSNKAIAQAAEVDLASINYHFKGREGLYQAVITEAHSQYFDEKDLIALAALDISAEEKLGLFFEKLTLNLLTGNTWYSQILIRELLTSSSRLDQFFKQDGNRKFLLILDMISEISGLSPNQPQILACMLSVMAPCFMLILAEINPLSPLHNVSKMDAQQLATHLKTFSIAGLKAIKNQHSEN